MILKVYQREQTIEACKLASLNCKYILEEPISAAHYIACYEKVYELLNEQIWIIYDFGGGTLDVALVRVGNFTLETLAIAGDGHLGGQDIDHAMDNAVKEAGEFLEKAAEKVLKLTIAVKRITPCERQ